MSKKWLFAIFSAAAMAFSAGALAQAPATPFYIGADIGKTEIGSEDDTAFRILGGYQFNPNFAVEAAWTSLLDKGGVEATALELVAVGMFPVAQQLSVYGKLGIARVDVEAGGFSDDRTELTYGLGLQYALSPKIGLRAQWQRYDTDDEADVFSIGVIFRF
jgi:OOP family OmpA-OmpF porin